MLRLAAHKLLRTGGLKNYASRASASCNRIAPSLSNRKIPRATPRLRSACESRVRRLRRSRAPSRLASPRPIESVYGTRS